MERYQDVGVNRGATGIPTKKTFRESERPFPWVSSCKSQVDGYRQPTTPFSTTMSSGSTSEPYTGFRVSS